MKRCKLIRRKVIRLLVAIVLTITLAHLVPYCTCQQQFSQFQNYPNGQLLSAFLEQNLQQNYMQQQQQQQDAANADLLSSEMNAQMLPLSPFESYASGPFQANLVAFGGQQLQQHQDLVQRQQQPLLAFEQQMQHLIPLPGQHQPNIELPVRKKIQPQSPPSTLRPNNLSRMDEQQQSDGKVSKSGERRWNLQAAAKLLSAPYESMQTRANNGSSTGSLRKSDTSPPSGFVASTGSVGEASERKFQAINAEVDEPLQAQLMGTPDEQEMSSELESSGHIGDYGSRKNSDSVSQEAEDQQQQLIDTNEDIATQNNDMDTPEDEVERQIEAKGEQSDEQLHQSYPPVHLPSQYDTVLRLPPEGYYDDYYKPAFSQQQEHVHDQSAQLTSRVENSPEFGSPDNQVRDSKAILNGYLAASANGSLEFEQAADSEDQPESNQEQGEPETIYEGPAALQRLNASLADADIMFSTPRVNSSSRLIDQEAREEDHGRVKLIVAKSNETRDPISNEKIISYTLSDGGQNTTQIGASKNSSSPRETFFNRDMNEFPLVQGDQTTREGLRSMQSREMPQSIQQLKGVQDNQDDQQKHSEQKTDSDDRISEEPIDSSSDSMGDELRRLEQNSSELAGPFGQYKDGVRIRQNKQQPSDNSDMTSGKLPVKQARRRSPKQQVTQVDLHPKELVTRAPERESSTASSQESGVLSSLAAIPNKMRKLHDNHPDKNELMNELLTALDKVKVAIYRLQPLTAKMNAMYRKSVSSNTRDIIMDNHKGQYAKRYPPGDYDDSYSRIRPSDLVVAGSNSFSRRFGTDIEASESDLQPIYVKFSNSSQPMNTTVVKQVEDQSHSAETQIVATGIGQRLENGTASGQLSISREEGQSLEYAASKWPLNEAQGEQRLSFELAPSYPSDDGESGDFERPLFGYRITIVQRPESFTSGADEEADQLATSESSLVLTSEPPNRVDAKQPDLQGASSTTFDEEPNEETGSDDDSSKKSEGDTSVEQPEDNEEGQEATEKDSDDDKEVAGSDKMSVKAKKKNIEKKKKKKVAGKEKKSEESKGKKSLKKKMLMEENKKKKEYKKIKHKKGVVSKESKKMKRDKHIKAHDRGLAKEKALKERTQIEFFEREQIVDDEYEKAKKSSKKAQWQVGQDSKKSTKENKSLGGGSADLAAGASDQVSAGERLQQQIATAASEHFDAIHGGGSESSKNSKQTSKLSSAKSSNKFEKKSMEARGKKIKGWREKGYKIITETEFVDRGSLHDSAYKKRDKGAAHHQKYKKHAAQSEGQHGSMSESSKKSKKKEEKKSKMEEKKEHQSKKKEQKKKNKKEQVMTKKVAHHSQPEVSFEEPDRQASASQQQRKLHRAGDSPLPSERHKEDSSGGSALSNLLKKTRPTTLRPHLQTRARLNSSSTTPSSNGRLNTTLLEIVDGATGRRLDKNRIGSYDLTEQEAQTTKQHQHNRRALLQNHSTKSTQLKQQSDNLKSLSEKPVFRPDARGRVAAVRDLQFTAQRKSEKHPEAEPRLRQADNGKLRESQGQQQDAQREAPQRLLYLAAINSQSHE